MSGLPPMPDNVNQAMLGMQTLATGAAFAFAVNARLTHTMLSDSPMKMIDFIDSFNDPRVPKLLVSIVPLRDGGYIAVYYEQET